MLRDWWVYYSQFAHRATPRKNPHFPFKSGKNQIRIRDQTHAHSSHTHRHLLDFAVSERKVHGNRRPNNIRNEATTTQQQRVHETVSQQFSWYHKQFLNAFVSRVPHCFSCALHSSPKWKKKPTENRREKKLKRKEKKSEEQTFFFVSLCFGHLLFTACSRSASACNRNVCLSVCRFLLFYSFVERSEKRSRNYASEETTTKKLKTFSPMRMDTWDSSNRAGERWDEQNKKKRKRKNKSFKLYGDYESLS